jgi:hypothetical protein
VDQVNIVPEFLHLIAQYDMSNSIAMLIEYNARLCNLLYSYMFCDGRRNCHSVALVVRCVLLCMAVKGGHVH